MLEVCFLCRILKRKIQELVVKKLQVRSNFYTGDCSCHSSSYVFMCVWQFRQFSWHISEPFLQFLSFFYICTFISWNHEAFAYAQLSFIQAETLGATRAQSLGKSFTNFRFGGSTLSCPDSWPHVEVFSDTEPQTEPWRLKSSFPSVLLLLSYSLGWLVTPRCALAWCDVVVRLVLH